MSLKDMTNTLSSTVARQQRRQAPPATTVITDKAPQVDPVLMEQSLVETCLPAHMLYLMSLSVRAQNYEFRADMQERLNAGGAAPLAAVAHDLNAVKRIAKRVDDTALRLLNVLSPDDPVHGMYCVANWVVRMVDEKLFVDVQNQGVLVALLMMDDLRLEGGVNGYSFREHTLKYDAEKLLMAARREGLYKDLKLVAANG
jgi:hypothetical protein